MATNTRYNVVGMEFDDPKLAQARADELNAAAYSAYLQSLSTAQAQRAALKQPDLKVGGLTLKPEDVFPDPVKPDPIVPIKVTYQEVWDVLNTANNAAVVIGVDQQTANAEVVRLAAESSGATSVTINTGSPDATNPSAMAQSELVLTDGNKYKAVRREQRVDA